MPNHHHHRAGSLRQNNKRNKRSKASKRNIAKASGAGRVNVKTTAATSGRARARSKADRRHHIQQKRNASRLALLQKKRGGGMIAGVNANANPPPRVVGIIALGQTETNGNSNMGVQDKLVSLLVDKADAATTTRQHKNSRGCGVTVKYNAYKKEGYVTFLTTSCCRSTTDQQNKYSSDDEAIMAALDLCRICDMIILVIDADGPTAAATDDDDAHDLLGMRIGGDSVDGTSSNSNATHKSRQQDWDHLISERGDRILTAIKGQGLPTPLTVLARTRNDDDQPGDHDCAMTMQSTKCVRRSAMKRHADLKRYVSRFATTEFGAEHNKVMEVDLTMVNDDDDDEAMVDDDVVETTVDRSRQVASDALVRTLCTMAASPPKWVAEAPRAYVIADSYHYDANAQELVLTGHVRGKVPFNVNSLVHVPNVGTLACKSVQKALPPLSRAKKAAMEEDEQPLFSDPTRRESLDMFATPDALDGEQNLVGFDEDDCEEYTEDNNEDAAVERPAGWSDYQSAWLDAVDDLDNDANDLDRGELAEELNRKSSSVSGDASVATGAAMDWDDDNEPSAQEKQVLLDQRRKEQKEELEFPDEVEIDEESNARDRFARYRSLKSFRKSYWDPKENLPESYGSIYHFSNFKATQRDVFADMKEVASAAYSAGDFWGRRNFDRDEESMDDCSDDPDNLLDGCIPSGSYVAITFESVTSFLVSPGTTLVAVSLLSHENKVSVLHMGLCQTANCDQPESPVKSKDVLTFRCGWRTWKARPVFSQNNLNSDKHKFERFLPQEGAFFAASVFGPVTYAPCPVLVFREDDRTETSEEKKGSYSQDLVAIGSLYGADADRIVVKRIILTGYPTRVHKRHATVKYMFYNPDDVRWFKPAGLTTKHGLHGHIVQSVGEHGTMKCLFNAPIKQHDTVMLPLYKRIFPKFAPVSANCLDDKKTDLVIR